MLMTMVVRADDFYLVQTPIQKEAATNMASIIFGVYILDLPKNSMVFNRFDSPEMEQTIARLVKAGDIPSGSVLHFDGSRFLRSPPDEQIQKFSDFCKRIGIKLVVTARL